MIKSIGTGQEIVIQGKWRKERKGGREEERRGEGDGN